MAGAGGTSAGGLFVQARDAEAAGQFGFDLIAVGVVVGQGGVDLGQDEAFVIHAGTVEIRRHFDGVDRVVNRIGEGQPLGEMAVFRGGAQRSASAVAAEDVELLVIKEERLEWLVRNRPQLALELLKRLSNLVVATDQERAQTHAGGVR